MNKTNFKKGGGETYCKFMQTNMQHVRLSMKIKPSFWMIYEIN